MLFNSFKYAVFLPVVTLVYFILPQRSRVLWLLAVSCIFYMVYRPEYILVLAALILIDYVAALKISAALEQGRSARLYLVGSIVSTCLVLFVFKYYNFVNGSIATLAAWAGFGYSFHRMRLPLPIGLSFHTFQSLSYVIEVYRGRQKAERNFLVYSTYVMFFPQLVAGPIERPQHLLHQFREHHKFDAARVVSGLKRIAWGLFKKCVVADRLGLFVGPIFGNPRESNGTQLLVASVFFTYQIYCDFSGYSDIAIGSARLLGFRLMENFRTPFYSQSMGEFWRRWHISLASWFRDYVFEPLGVSRAASPRALRNYIITFTLSGLWHGAGLTYALWGVFNGCLVALDAMTHSLHRRWSAAVAAYRYASAPIGIAVTFLLTCAGFVLFRANRVSDAVYILTHLEFPRSLQSVATVDFRIFDLEVAFASILILELAQLLQMRWPIPDIVAGLPLAVRWSAYLAFAFVLAFFGVYDSNPFIYFQF